ncbi:hypothetical protein TrispH2_004195 [Trichoplax sp. H2]|nr:hypothetical protein TrispH2_004195 [Trichoplax sp. H2]|eukprot:RDD44001.1 hypothetical protein TrispH2_004195 [Trichoplax sp. H2]
MEHVTAKGCQIDQVETDIHAIIAISIHFAKRIAASPLTLQITKQFDQQPAAMVKPDSKYKWQVWHIEKQVWLHFVRVTRKADKPSPFLKCNEIEFSPNDNDVIISWNGRRVQVWKLVDEIFHSDKTWIAHHNDILLCQFVEGGQKLITWCLFKQQYTPLNDPGQFIPKALGLSWNTELKVWSTENYRELQKIKLKYTLFRNQFVGLPTVLFQFECTKYVNNDLLLVDCSSSVSDHKYYTLPLHDYNDKNGIVIENCRPPSEYQCQYLDNMDKVSIFDNGKGLAGLYLQEIKIYLYERNGMVPYQTIDLGADILWRSFQFVPGADNRFIFADTERCYLVAIKDDKDPKQSNHSIPAVFGDVQCQRLEFIDGVIVCAKIISTTDGERFLQVYKGDDFQLIDQTILRHGRRADVGVNCHLFKDWNYVAIVYFIEQRQESRLYFSITYALVWILNCSNGETLATFYMRSCDTMKIMHLFNRYLIAASAGGQIHTVWKLDSNSIEILEKIQPDLNDISLLSVSHVDITDTGPKVQTISVPKHNEYFDGWHIEFEKPMTKNGVEIYRVENDQRQLIQSMTNLSGQSLFIVRNGKDFTAYNSNNNLLMKVYRGKYCYPSQPLEYEVQLWSDNDHTLATYYDETIRLYTIEHEHWFHTIQSKELKDLKFIQISNEFSLWAYKTLCSCPYYIKPVLPSFDNVENIPIIIKPSSDEIAFRQQKVRFNEGDLINQGSPSVQNTEEESQVISETITSQIYSDEITTEADVHTSCQLNSGNTMIKANSPPIHGEENAQSISKNTFQSQETAQDNQEDVPHQRPLLSGDNLKTFALEKTSELSNSKPENALDIEKKTVKTPFNFKPKKAAEIDWTTTMKQQFNSKPENELEIEEKKMEQLFNSKLRNEPKEDWLSNKPLSPKLNSKPRIEQDSYWTMKNLQLKFDHDNIPDIEKKLSKKSLNSKPEHVPDIEWQEMKKQQKSKEENTPEIEWKTLKQHEESVRKFDKNTTLRRNTMESVDPVEKLPVFQLIDSIEILDENLPIPLKENMEIQDENLPIPLNEGNEMSVMKLLDLLDEEGEIPVDVLPLQTDEGKETLAENLPILTDERKETSVEELAVLIEEEKEAPVEKFPVLGSEEKECPEEKLLDMTQNDFNLNVFKPCNLLNIHVNLYIFLSTSEGNETPAEKLPVPTKESLEQPDENLAKQAHTFEENTQDGRINNENTQDNIVINNDNMQHCHINNKDIQDSHPYKENTQVLNRDVAIQRSEELPKSKKDKLVIIRKNGGCDKLIEDSSNIQNNCVELETLNDSSEPQNERNLNIIDKSEPVIGLVSVNKANTNILTPKLENGNIPERNSSPRCTEESVPMAEENSAMDCNENVVNADKDIVNNKAEKGQIVKEDSSNIVNVNTHEKVDKIRAKSEEIMQETKADSSNITNAQVKDIPIEVNRDRVQINMEAAINMAEASFENTEKSSSNKTEESIVNIKGNLSNVIKEPGQSPDFNLAPTSSSINNREIFNKEKRPEQSNDHDPSYQNLQESSSVEDSYSIIKKSPRSKIARNGIDSVDDCLAQERTTENIDLIEDPLARENFAEMCVCLADKQSVQERSAEEGIDLVDDGSRHCISSGEEALNLLHDNSSLLWYGKLVVESN